MRNLLLLAVVLAGCLPDPLDQVGPPPKGPTRNSIPEFSLEPVGDNGCVAKTLGATKYELWDCVDLKPAGMGWRFVVTIEADDTSRHVASIGETIRDELGWVTDYVDQQGTTWRLPDGWQVIGIDIRQTNCLLSTPGNEPGSYNCGFGGEMVNLYYEADDETFTIHQKSLNDWWGGDRKEGYGSYQDASCPLQKVELHFKVCEKLER